MATSSAAVRACARTADPATHANAVPMTAATGVRDPTARFTATGAATASRPIGTLTGRSAAAAARAASATRNSTAESPSAGR